MTPPLRLLVVILVAAWLGSLAVRPLYKPDEARYGEIAREMAQSGDWVTPRLNGFKYFEKPPLQYWASAAALKVFGKHDWTARLWTGVMALAGIGLVFQAGRQLFSPSAGLLAAAVLAGSPLYLLVGQVNTLDMGVTVFLSAAAFSFALAWHRDTPPSRRTLWMLAFWAACGMAVLSKGLIGIVLPCTAVGLYIVLRRDWPLVGRLEFLRGGALFAAIVAPWFICVALAHREFLYFFFVQEHWLRYTTAIHQREGAAWFYVPVLAAGVAPWLLVVLAASAASLRGLGNRGFATEFFLFLWALTVFAFFSVSHSKLPAYILPMLPALALLAGSFLAREGRSGLLIAQSLLLAGGGIALASALPDSASFADWSGARFVAAYCPWLAAAASITGGRGIRHSLCITRKKPSLRSLHRAWIGRGLPHCTCGPPGVRPDVQRGRNRRRDPTRTFKRGAIFRRGQLRSQLAMGAGSHCHHGSSHG